MRSMSWRLVFVEVAEGGRRGVGRVGGGGGGGGGGGPRWRPGRRLGRWNQ